MIDLFLKGGLLMYPLLACSLVSLAVIIEKTGAFWGDRGDRAGADALLQAAGAGDLVRAEALAGAPGGGRAGPRTRLLADALAARALPRAELESRLSRLGSAQLKGLARRLHLLELIGKVSPMLGLTGTVTGLARAFRTVAQLRQVSDPGLLASGIWEALITTIAGLFIGIPTLIAYHLFDNRLKSLALDMQSCGEELLARLDRQR